MQKGGALEGREYMSQHQARIKQGSSCLIAHALAIALYNCHTEAVGIC